MSESRNTAAAISFNPLWKTLIDKNMTRGELCEAAGIARATVTKMGKNKPVALEIIVRICNALHVPVEQVMEIKSITPAP